MQLIITEPAELQRSIVEATECGKTLEHKADVSIFKLITGTTNVFVKSLQGLFGIIVGRIV